VSQSMPSSSSHLQPAPGGAPPAKSHERVQFSSYPGLAREDQEIKQGSGMEAKHSGRLPFVAGLRSPYHTTKVD
jgi:hypothetical protein